MAKEKQTEPKKVLEREYIVPLRKGWLKVPKYKRASKAVKTLKEFIARHMRIYDSDLRRVKLDIDLNNEIRFRGMKKPPAKIKVRAVKLDNGIVRVELIDLPAHIKFARLKKVKEIKPVKKKVEKKPEEDEEEEEDKDKKIKEEASKEETMKIAKQKAKELKHVSKDKGVKIQRKALSR